MLVKLMDATEIGKSRMAASKLEILIAYTNFTPDSK